MSEDRLWYEAARFAADYRVTPVDKRLAFDAWADRRGFGPDLKRRLWRKVKAVARRAA